MKAFKKVFAALLAAVVMVGATSSSLIVAAAEESAPEETIAETAAEAPSDETPAPEEAQQENFQQPSTRSGKITIPKTPRLGLDLSEVFSKWVNYPGSKYGHGYDAGWGYSASTGLSTTKNVGWTGYYNPDITDFTAGIFEFELQSTDADPLGFAWGMKTGGTDADPTYSFYAFEECGHGDWSVAYISEWHPANSDASHQGPLYHGTIDAKDGQYDHTGKKGAVGFATGSVLAYGTLPAAIGSPNVQHKVKIEVEDDKFIIYLNGTELTTVTAPVQAGSFGPFATSNPDAHILGLSFTTKSNDFLEAKFEYRDAENKKINESMIGDPIVIEDLSSFTTSPIVDREWTVVKDGVQVYSGKTPYDKYHEAIGTYETTLVVINDQGIVSAAYKDTLVVKEKVVVSTPSTPTTNAKTGDSNQIAVFGFIMLLSLAVIGYSVKKRNTVK